MFNSIKVNARFCYNKTLIEIVRALLSNAKLDGWTVDSIPVFNTYRMNEFRFGNVSLFDALQSAAKHFSCKMEIDYDNKIIRLR